MSGGKKLTVNERIKRIYFGTHPGSLMSPKTFAKLHPEFTIRQIKQFFKSEFVTKLWFPHKQRGEKFVMHNIARYFGHRIQSDLGFFPEIVLVVVDTFTKYLSTRLIPDKNAKTVAEAFKTIYEKDYGPYLWIPGTSLVLLVDQGGEYKGEFKKTCHHLDIDIQTLASSAAKANLSERMVGILKRRLSILAEHDEDSFEKHLDKATRGWNMTPTKVLNFVSPADLRARKKSALDKYAEKFAPVLTWKEVEAHYIKSMKAYPWLTEGIWVRITTTGKTIFEKNSAKAANSLELFQVILIRWPSPYNRTQAPYVQLADYNGEAIKGKFRVNEIIQTDENPKKPNWTGMVTFIGKKTTDSDYRVQFAGKRKFKKKPRFLDHVLRYLSSAILDAGRLGEMT